MKIKSQNILYAIIMIICYMYIITVADSFGIQIDYFSHSSKRTQLLMCVLLISGSYIVCKQTLIYNKIIISASILTLYMFQVGIFTYTELLPWLSCSVMWFLIILFIFNIAVRDTDLEKLSIIFSVTLLLLSIIYVYGVLNPNIINTVANSNSIYYILGVIPFVLLGPNKKNKIIYLCIASCTFIISKKGTCILAIIAIWIIIINKWVVWKKINKKKLYLTCLIVLFCFIRWLILIRTDGHSSVDVILDTFNELLNGGNGRIEIYRNLLNAFTESTLMSQVLGHGYASVNDAISIGSHNDFLMVLYCYGIIGLFLYGIFWVRLIQGMKQIKQNESEYSLAYRASIIIFFALSMASNVLNTQIEFLLLCVFWGICSPGKKIVKNNGNER